MAFDEKKRLREWISPSGIGLTAATTLNGLRQPFHEPAALSADPDRLLLWPDSSAPWSRFLSPTYFCASRIAVPQCAARGAHGLAPRAVDVVGCAHGETRVSC